MNEVNLDGMTGVPVPLMLRSDGWVTCILFLCLIVVSFILSKEKKYLYQQMKFFVSSRERASMFDDTMMIDMRYIILLLLNTCVLVGLSIYDYISRVSPEVLEIVPRRLLLLFSIVVPIVFLSLKVGIYRFVNWIFFPKARNMIWEDSYLNVQIWMGFVLFPIVLLIIYWRLSMQMSFLLVGSIIIFAKIVLFCKCFTNFFGKIHGLIHLILYFCALEILPDLILWKGIEVVINNLI